MAIEYLFLIFLANQYFSCNYSNINLLALILIILSFLYTSLTYELLQKYYI